MYTKQNNSHNSSFAVKQMLHWFIVEERAECECVDLLVKLLFYPPPCSYM